MTTLVIQVDSRTERGLRQLSETEGGDVAQVAARLLARAVRATRPRPVYDTDTLKTAYAAFAEEDEALAEAASTERADLLAQEEV
jgi:hypothetical protein